MGLRTGNNSDWLTKFLTLRGAKPQPLAPAEVTGLAPSSVLDPIFKAGQTAIANNTTDTSGSKWFNADAPIPQVSTLIPSLAPSSPNSFEQGPYYPQPVSPSLSWNETRNKNEMDALNSSVSPMDVQIAKNSAEAAARQKMLDTISAAPLPVRPQYTPPAYTPMPTREQVPYPNRPAPQVDAGGSFLALLAGAVDPTHAGQYNASPFAAAVTRANEDFENKKNAFAYAVNQADKAYQDAVNSHNAETQHALDVTQANYKNAGSEWQDASDRLHFLTETARQQGGVDELNNTNANLAPLVKRDSESGVFGLLGKQAGRRIDEGNLNNKLQSALNIKQAQIDGMLAGKTIGANASMYGADRRAETSTANNTLTNQTKKDIAGDNNATRKTIAAGHDGSRERVASARVQALLQRGTTIAPKLPPQLASQLRVYGNILSNAHNGMRASVDKAKKVASDAMMMTQVDLNAPPEQQKAVRQAAYDKAYQDFMSTHNASLQEATSSYQQILGQVEQWKPPVTNSAGQRPATSVAPAQGDFVLKSVRERK